MNFLDALYRIGLSLDQQRNLRRRKKLPFKVISIGNLTMGGTGKTPATIAIGLEAKARGFSPCILTRGYGGRARGPCFVSFGDGPVMNEREAGDEAVLISEKLPGVPVVKGADRYEAGAFAIRKLKPESANFIFILDDGFQHLRLGRDKDILLIDGLVPLSASRLIPRGTLREPPDAMGRADIVVVTKVGEKLGTPFESYIRKYNPTAPLYLSDHKISHFISPKGEVVPLSWAEGRKVFGFSGIGNPVSFEMSLRRTGVEVRGFMHFRDHRRYRARNLAALKAAAVSSGAGWIVTTEKDIIRLKACSLPPNVLALVIDFHVQQEFYDEVFNL
jgi:tetraacyldisaccharide 4'-kinase